MIVERGVQYLRLARFDRPAGILLLLWPTMWGVWSAAEGFPGVGWLSVFVVGVCATRAFGGVVNDIVDRRLDSQVWRTRDRPLASGAISLAEAFGVALFFLLIAAALWWWALPPPAKWVAVAGLILTLVYPTIKHFFSMPQLMLGLVFSIGILVADSAIRNAFPSTTAWLFFVGNFFWIVAYDTVYAMADRDDDRRHGKIGSMALFLGKRDIAVVSLLYAAAVLWLSATGLIVGYGAAYQLALVAAMLCVLAFWRLYKTRDPVACLSVFRANHWLGFWVFIGIVAST